MARILHRLSARSVASMVRAGYHPDGGGLYLQVTSTGAKSWIFRYSRHNTAHEMGLGSVNAVTLAAARDAAQRCRAQLAEGTDPLQVRRVIRQGEKLKRASAMTFKACADGYVAAHAASWRNAKHAAQWTTTLTNYAYPVLGTLSVQSIDTGLVLRVLEPIWRTKTETASRLRGRIESVLDWAAARNHRAGENPARWRGHLDQLLPARSKVQQVVHHPALPYAEVPAFIRTLSAMPGAGALALMFQILTAARTGEVIGAVWDELDLEDATWIVPGVRMKTGREHRVPLSSGARAVLRQMQQIRQSEFVFPGMKAGRPLSNMALLQVLKRMERSDLTAHGFRSSFRDWAAEMTDVSGEVAEMSLAHIVKDKVEAAYRRGDLFEKRRQLMEAWSAHCMQPEEQTSAPS